MNTLNTLKRWFLIVLTFTAITAAPFHAALAAVAPSLGTADSFAVLGSSTVTNTGPTIVNGDLGVSPGTAVTGFPPGTVIGGTIHAADAVAGGAQSDTTAAYNNLAGQACDFNLTGQDLGGLTLVEGVYCFSSSAQLTGALTLDAQGDPNAVWVFQIGTTLTTASASSVQIINGGQQCNVFWQIGSSATLGTTTSFTGNILALASVTLTTGATVSGRALAQNGAVTMDSNIVTRSACAGPPVTPIPPTLSKAFSPATIDAGDTSTLTITLSNPDATVATNASFTDTLPTGVVIDGIASTTCGGTVTTGTSTVTLAGGSIPGNGSCTVTVDVTAATGGNYLNSLAAGALQTGNGSNAAPAIATLTVNPNPPPTTTTTLPPTTTTTTLPPPPTTTTLPKTTTTTLPKTTTTTLPKTTTTTLPPTTTTTLPRTNVPPKLSKSFSPATIKAGGVSTLTITLSNTNATKANLTASLTDTLPGGVVVSGSATTTCGGTVAASKGGTKVTLTGGSIPAKGSCTVTVKVTAKYKGSYVNKLLVGALKTDKGSNAQAAATLTVTDYKK